MATQHHRSLHIKVFTLVALLWTSLATAALDIEIRQAEQRALPIGIRQFTITRATPQFLQIAQVVKNDLTRSGRFAPVSSPSLSQQTSEVTSAVLQQWRKKGADTLLSGSLQALANDQYRVRFTLWDTYEPRLSQKAQATLLQGDYTIAGKDWRRLAHHISDQVYQKLTGRRGAFSSYLAYVAVQRRAGGTFHYTLEVSDFDGSEPHRLVESAAPLLSPAWSPDARLLAYVSLENHRASVRIIDRITGKSKVVSQFPGINSAPAWSPDGKQLALVLSHGEVPNIYVLTLATGRLKQLTSGSAIDTEPSWSPDGRSLVFTSNRGGRPQIYRLQLAGGDIKRLTFEGDYNARASFTPDGKHIVMSHRVRGRYTVAIQDLGSGQLSILAHSRLGESPSVAPNGDMVVYAARGKKGGVLMQVAMNGRKAVPLARNDGDVQEPAWSPFIE